MPGWLSCVSFNVVVGGVSQHGYGCGDGGGTAHLAGQACAALRH